MAFHLGFAFWFWFGFSPLVPFLISMHLLTILLVHPLWYTVPGICRQRALIRSVIFQEIRS